MKKFLLFLILAFQCVTMNAENRVNLFNSSLTPTQTRVSINDSNLKTRASDSDDNWVSIGKGFWTDGYLIWTDTGEAATDSVLVEKSKMRPNVYRVWPFKDEGVYQGHIVVHCENSQMVYFEPFTITLQDQTLFFTQAVEEYDCSINNQYWYGQLSRETLSIPLESFVAEYNGEKVVFTSNNPFTLTLPKGYDNPINKESGVYMGLASFNDEVKTKSISILNAKTCDDFTSFVDNMRMGTFTNLYKAVDNSIDNLKSNIYPDDLTKVILITFTDGLDMGSLDGSPFIVNKEYADYLANKISETTIQGIPLEAYSIGLMSTDVYDEEQFMYNLNSIASKKDMENPSSSNIDYVCTVNDMQGLENQLIKIYENVNRQINHREITITVPMMEHESTVRFTLDGIGDSKKARDSQVWFEGTFNRLDMTFENVTYNGFTSTSGNVFSITKNPIKAGGYDVILHDCHDFNGNLLEVGQDNIDQWIYLPSRDDYQHNRENAKKDDIKIEDIKTSIAIMLALDASKSLESSEQGNLFPLVKSSANSFINLLAGNSNQSGIVDTLIKDQTEFDINDPDVEIYNLQGMKVKEPTSGIYIYRKGKAVKKVLVR